MKARRDTKVDMMIRWLWWWWWIDDGETTICIALYKRNKTEIFDTGFWVYLKSLLPSMNMPCELVSSVSLLLLPFPDCRTQYLLTVWTLYGVVLLTLKPNRDARATDHWTICGFSLNRSAEDTENCFFKRSENIIPVYTSPLSRWVLFIYSGNSNGTNF